MARNVTDHGCRQRALTLAGAIALAAASLAALPATAQDVKFGKELWLGKVNCRDCHGWGGHGVGDNPQAVNGANLRTTKLDDDQLAEAIRCGRPGTEMPFFDRLAYTDKRCYGMTAAELGKDAPAAGIANLNAREISAMIAMFRATFVGKGAPTFEECKEMFGPTATRCDLYPKAGN